MAYTCDGRSEVSDIIDTNDLDISGGNNSEEEEKKPSKQVRGNQNLNKPMRK
jgi:hypothetical protein